VSANGLITPGCAGLYRDEHEAAWSTAVETVHGSGAALAVRVGHAGRRGSTRSRRQGVDRPLAGTGWPLLAPSPIPFATNSTVPEEMADRDLEWVRDAFADAAGRAAAAGIDVLLLHMGHGYLLGSFLSPLTNVRTDGFGGDIHARMRYPLEVFDAVRTAWPEERPLGVAMQVSDAASGGWNEDDAVALAQALAARGCDLIEPVVGQTVPESQPRYAPGFLIPSADRIRNEAGIATLVGGGISTTVQVNTALAAARADLCILSAR
jgi:anthraniloyl-CoA monooxygenase